MLRPRDRRRWLCQHGSVCSIPIWTVRIGSSTGARGTLCCHWLCPKRNRKRHFFTLPSFKSSSYSSVPLLQTVLQKTWANSLKWMVLLYTTGTHISIAVVKSLQLIGGSFWPTIRLSNKLKPDCTSWSRVMLLKKLDRISVCREKRNWKGKENWCVK